MSPPSSSGCTSRGARSVRVRASLAVWSNGIPCAAETPVCAETRAGDGAASATGDAPLTISSAQSPKAEKARAGKEHTALLTRKILVTEHLGWQIEWCVLSDRLRGTCRHTLGESSPPLSDLDGPGGLARQNRVGRIL